MRILILGGTGFIGPWQVRYALAQGHQVTVFNRGQTSPGSLPCDVEILAGNRENDLRSLQDREWDVVIDNPTTLPAWVRDVGEILRGRVQCYIFISTIAVYADHSQPNQTEFGLLKTYNGPDAMRETQQTIIDSQRALYGPLKVLAEAEAEKYFPGQTLIIRPGLIVGPGDETDRFTYWPVRLARGGPVLAPGTPHDPVQIIDVRDLAEWSIRLAEMQATGIYNAVGPAERLTIGTLLGQICHGFGSQAKITWVDADFLETHHVAAWSDLPVWVPPAEPMAGFTTISNQKALANGLTFRPLLETARDTVEWFQRQTPQRQAHLRSGLAPNRENSLLAAWLAS